MDNWADCSPDRSLISCDRGYRWTSLAERLTTFSMRLQQSLKDPGGALLLLGCAHAGLRNTVQQVEAMTEKPLRVVVGGLHLTKAMNVTCARVRYSYVNEAWNSLQHLTARDAKLRIFWVIT